MGRKKASPERAREEREPGDIKEDLISPPDDHLPFDKGLSTGSSLLNLAFTGRIDVGLLPGKYYLYVGQSNGGKTWLGHSALAEASVNPIYDDYRLIYDNCEDGALFEVEKFFGKSLAQRLEPPFRDSHGDVFSSTVQEFYYNLDDVCEQGKPFIYILDSMDAIDTKQNEKKFDTNKKIFRKAQERDSDVEEEKDGKEKGSYGDGKAAVNSGLLRRIVNTELRKTNSILIIISQWRDNIGFGAIYNPHTRSGGHALSFYATIEMWTSVKEQIKKTARGKERHIGNSCKMEVKRSRVTGRRCSVDVPIYFSYGIDDVGSMVDFLVEENHWKKSGGINAKELGLNEKRDDLIQAIEDGKLESKLKHVVQGVWDDIEEACSIKRKQRYGE